MKDTPHTIKGAHEDVPKGHLFIAKYVHKLVYFSLIMLPTTGLLIAGLFNLGMEGIEVAIALHEFSAFLSYIVIALHVGASFILDIKVKDHNAMCLKETQKNSSDIISKLEKLEHKFYEKIEKVID